LIFQDARFVDPICGSTGNPEPLGGFKPRDDQAQVKNGATAGRWDVGHAEQGVHQNFFDF
jgi:hypothetical protein